MARTKGSKASLGRHKRRRNASEQDDEHDEHELYDEPDDQPQEPQEHTAGLELEFDGELSEPETTVHSPAPENVTTNEHRSEPIKDERRRQRMKDVMRKRESIRSEESVTFDHVITCVRILDNAVINSEHVCGLLSTPGEHVNGNRQTRLRLSVLAELQRVGLTARDAVEKILREVEKQNVELVELVELDTSNEEG